jgi:hypothetical protein
VCVCGGGGLVRATAVEEQGREERAGERGERKVRT